MRTKMTGKLINPFDYIESENPEALQFLIGSGLDLDLETELMIARADAQRRPYRLPDGRNPALVPNDICAAVIDGPGVAADMRAEIEALTGQPAVY